MSYIDSLLSFELVIENRKTKQTKVVNNSIIEHKRKDGFKVLKELVERANKNEVQAAVLYTAVCFFKGNEADLSRFELFGNRLAVLNRIKGIYGRKKAKEKREFLDEVVNNINYGYKWLPAEEKIVFRDLQHFIENNLQ